MWYDRPAESWMNDALPLGNGALGAMLFGRTDCERIQFNEKTLWTGDEQDVGAYQAFGDVLIRLDHSQPQRYRRELDLKRAVQRVSYDHASVHFERIAFASHPANVIALRLAADKPAAYSGRIWLTDMHNANLLVNGNRIRATGVLNNNLAYESQLVVLNEGGQLSSQVEGGWDIPMPHARRGSVVLDGTTDIYVGFKSSSQPILNYYSQKTNDDGDTDNSALILGDAWFDRGVSFDTPNALTFQLDNKYRWLTFHAQARGPVAIELWLDGNRVHHINVPVSPEPPRYFSFPVAGVGALKISATQEASPKPHTLLLGHLRLSPNVSAPEFDPGISRQSSNDFLPGWNRPLSGVSITFEKCDHLTLLLTAGTNYAPDVAHGWRREHPHTRIEEALKYAADRKFSDLLSEHQEDYQSLFNRVSLNLGRSDDRPAALPTDQRLIQYSKGGHDPELESMFFDFGRYLLISSSRPGGLPANLQGVWNDSNTPPWRCDYHSNINVQMNYWPAETTNLSECHMPLIDFICSQIPIYTQDTAAQFPNHRGWALRTESGIFGASGWNWNLPANAWYCHHLWEHFSFTADDNYLRTIAYPQLKHICQFWEDHLTALPDGTLVTPDGWSPEWGPCEPGVTYDQELIWDLFANYLAAEEAIGVDPAYRSTVAAMQAKLLKPKVGQHGQLQEWMDDKDDLTSHHRHVSHLWGLYPGHQISTATTPDLAQAAKVSLLARGDESTGWSKAWKINFWARLGDGDHAYTLLRSLLRPVTADQINYDAGGGVTFNLLDSHPPFQIDGNFGATAGIAEMLLQSHAGEIDLLPALPKEWPTGSVTGLRARGGFTVDIKWNDARITQYRVASAQPRPVQLRIHGQLQCITSESTTVTDALSPIAHPGSMSVSAFSAPSPLSSSTSTELLTNSPQSN